MFSEVLGQQEEEYEAELRALMSAAQGELAAERASTAKMRVGAPDHPPARPPFSCSYSRISFLASFSISAFNFFCFFLLLLLPPFEFSSSRAGSHAFNATLTDPFLAPQWRSVSAHLSVVRARR